MQYKNCYHTVEFKFKILRGAHSQYSSLLIGNICDLIYLKDKKCHFIQSIKIPLLKEPNTWLMDMV